MPALKALTNTLARWWESFLGPRTVTDVTKSSVGLESLSGHSVEGYVIQVFCEERRYCVHYKRWYVPDRHYHIYKVFCTVHGWAPSSLQRAFSREYAFPTLILDWSPSTAHKSASIEAYLDVVLADIKAEIKTA